MAGKKKNTHSKAPEENSVIELEFTAVSMANSVSTVVEESSHVTGGQEAQVLSLPTRQAGPSLSEGEIKAQVADAKTEIVALYAQEAKVLEYQMNQLIKKLYAQNPESKPLLMKMKKLLSEHSNIKKILEKEPIKKTKKAS